MQETRIVTLRIKRVYFDKILSGEKRVEYRHFKDYYVKMFEGYEPTVLRLHYQQGPMLQVGIKSIKVIPTPERLLNSPLSFGRVVFAISLKGKAKLIKK